EDSIEIAFPEIAHPEIAHCGRLRARGVTNRSSSGDPERRFRLVRDGAECGGIVHREVRQHLAVDREACLLDTADETAVGQAVRARGRIDARNPERAELALLRSAVPICVLARLDDGLLGRAIDLAPGVVVALRLR